MATASLPGRPPSTAAEVARRSVALGLVQSKESETQWKFLSRMRRPTGGATGFTRFGAEGRSSVGSRVHCYVVLAGGGGLSFGNENAYPAS